MCILIVYYTSVYGIGTNELMYMHIHVCVLGRHNDDCLLLEAPYYYTMAFTCVATYIILILSLLLKMCVEIMCPAHAPAHLAN